jgi:hypothetical protein
MKAPSGAGESYALYGVKEMVLGRGKATKTF